MPKMTVNQKRTFAKAFLKEEAKGNPILLGLLAAFMPLILKMLEALFAKESE